MHQPWFVKSACFVLALSITSAAMAKPPWQLISFRSVRADPKAEYRLAEDHGPWLIFATSFAGEGAAQKQREAESA